MLRRMRQVLIALGFSTMAVAIAEAAQRFPPPDFQSGYSLPTTPSPPARWFWLEYLDVAVLAVALGLATWLALRKRSRKGLLALSIFSLLYFGFFRQGCICAIGSLQNVALAIGDPSYSLPVPALAFFVLPLLFALYAGRTFCASVCPHGALQDLFLVKPLRVPKWLEESLGLIPFFYLGAAVILAATGTAFLVCRYDPFIPMFRLSGHFGLLLFGGALLVLGLFVGRPYCRFLCPYGAMLRLFSKISFGRVTVTPTQCTQCRLCEQACPFGAIEKPGPLPAREHLKAERARVAVFVLLLPLLILLGIWSGAKLGPPASRLHPTVQRAEIYALQQQSPESVLPPDPSNPIRPITDPKSFLDEAKAIRARLTTGGSIFGAWVGLVIGLKLIQLSTHRRRRDYEPNPGGCVACGRCFEYCPFDASHALKAGCGGQCK